ncbi:hypothetical protein M153_668000337 [Pseudoloma neurophilia]|uniref:Uncharacterized protein n=1 Tax=Pseudoloma neurophilia TaxID=146866 RepID=A0A0R0LWD0_9MICR|nr:hypothetical protein M153_668000337 [Pseudoloma neurophilia]
MSICLCTVYSNLNHFLFHLKLKMPPCPQTFFSSQMSHLFINDTLFNSKDFLRRLLVKENESEFLITFLNEMKEPEEQHIVTENDLMADRPNKDKDVDEFEEDLDYTTLFSQNMDNLGYFTDNTTEEATIEEIQTNNHKTNEFETNDDKNAEKFFLTDSSSFSGKDTFSQKNTTSSPKSQNIQKNENQIKMNKKILLITDKPCLLHPIDTFQSRSIDILILEDHTISELKTILECYKTVVIYKLTLFQASILCKLSENCIVIGKNGYKLRCQNGKYFLEEKFVDFS